MAKSKGVYASLEKRKMNKMREVIRQRDNHECQICGRNNNLEVHHIKAIHLGGLSEPDNLITLCSFCHAYAPETGWVEFSKYMKDKGGYTYDRMMELPELNTLIEDIFLEYIISTLRVYLHLDLISDEQYRAIVNHELCKRGKLKQGE